MKRSAQRSLPLTLGAPALALAFIFGAGPVLAAPTAAGTIISNQATINYTDGNANAYTATSNTVQTTVQNVPALTVSAAAGANYAPGSVVSDSFTLTNTGNGTGTFNLTGASNGITVPGTATAVSYIYNATSYATVALLQAALPATASGSSVTIGVQYTIPTSTTAGTSEPTVVTATISYAANGLAPAVTSSSASATETDTVAADARLDLQKTSVQPASSGATIGYTITANDGGGMPAKDLASVKTLLGAASGGILITDQVPVFAGSPLTVNTIAVSTSAVNGYLGGSTKIYVSPSGLTGTWTAYTGPGNALAGTKYIGVFISGGTGGIELAAKPGGSTNGNVTAPAVTLTFQAVQPAGNGSADANSVLNAADSVIGGNQTPQNVIGPGIPANTADSVATITTAGEGILYPTQAAPAAAPGGTTGASNTVGNSAFAAQAVLNGPFGYPAATGSYNGVVANNDNNHDFTAKSFDPAGFNQSNAQTTLGSGPIGNTLGAVYVLDVPGTFQNSGNAQQNVTLSAALPAGWVAQIFNADASGVKTGSTLSGAASATPSATFAGVASGASVNYVVEYTAPANAQAFVTYDTPITATGAGGGTNVTHDELIPGGPLYLFKTATLDGATCPNSLAVSGCKITYDVYYYNNAPTVTACAAPTTSVLTLAGGYFAAAGTSIVTEDGAATNNSWAANTNGLTAAATDTTANTTWTGNSAGSTHFTATIGGATYVFYPGCTGHIDFSVIVK